MFRRLQLHLRRSRRQTEATIWLSHQATWIAATMVLVVTTWNALGLSDLPTSRLKTVSVITLLLASFWTGTLLAGAVFLLSFPLRRWMHEARWAEYLLVFIAAILNACIVPYIDFFATHPAPAHLRYLVDWEFMGSSASAAANPRFLLVTITPMLVLALFSPVIERFLAGKPRRTVVRIILVLLAFSGLCQAAKVNLNTKKFGWQLAPQSLRVTSVEHLLTEGMKLFGKHSFTSAERALLLEIAEAKSDQSPRAIALEKPIRGAENPLGLALKNVVATRLKEGRPVIFFVVLLESFRPMESRLFEPRLAASQMPNFDALAANGVLFRNAWATSNVTRSAQEAVACGLTTGPMTSIMRDKVQNSPKCLPDFFEEQWPNSSVSAFWHAGRFAFDSQGFFWRKHHMQKVLTHEDFPKDVPRSYWGKSDLALVERVFSDWPELSRNRTGPEFHLFLSVTNHHDFKLPSDAPSFLVNLAASETIPKNVATHRYTDEALGKLITELRRQKRGDETLWDGTLLFVLGDHGTLMPTSLHPKGFKFGLGHDSDLEAARASSHLALALSGGLTENALFASGLKNFEDNTPRSQPDIAATIADLAGLNGFHSSSDSLFATKRRWPVTVDLLDRVFFPEHNSVLPSEALDREVRAEDGVESKAKLFLRATRNLLDNGEAGSGR